MNLLKHLSSCTSYTSGTLFVVLPHDQQNFYTEPKMCSCNIFRDRPVGRKGFEIIEQLAKGVTAVMVVPTLSWSWSKVKNVILHLSRPIGMSTLKEKTNEFDEIT